MGSIITLSMVLWTSYKTVHKNDNIVEWYCFIWYKCFKSCLFFPNIVTCEIQIENAFDQGKVKNSNDIPKY